MFWRAVPGQEVVKAASGMAVAHALEHVFEIGIGLDVVELCRGDEGTDHGPSLCAAIGAGEQVVLAPERHGPDGAFDRVVVELDTSVIEEPAQRRPARERIADGVGQSATVRDAAKLGLEPGFHCF